MVTNFEYDTLRLENLILRSLIACEAAGLTKTVDDLECALDLVRLMHDYEEEVD